MAATQIRYAPTVIGVNSTVSTTGMALGNFLPATTGAITIIRNSDNLTLLSAMPVTAGIAIELEIFVGALGATVTTTLGASGLLGVAH
jgi:hypothetical protein